VVGGSGGRRIYSPGRALASIVKLACYCIVFFPYRWRNMAATDSKHSLAFNLQVYRLKNQAL